MKPSAYILTIACATITAAGCTRSGESENMNATNPVAQDTAVVSQTDTVPMVQTTDYLDYDIATEEDALAFMESSEHKEQYKNGIIPRIASQNLEYAANLLANTHPYFVIADKTSMYVILYNKFGVEQDRYRMCCSKKYGTKHAKRDNRTPEGYFTAGKTYDSTDWLYTDDDGNTSNVKGQFGPRFIRLTIPVTTQIGIHGTCAPWSLGKRSSHGCIRIHNDNILKLVELIDSGTPVIINPSLRDQKVNEEEGHHIPRLILSKHKEMSEKPVLPDTDTVRLEQDTIQIPIEIPADSDSIQFTDSISIPQIFE